MRRAPSYERVEQARAEVRKLDELLHEQRLAYLDLCDAIGRTLATPHGDELEQLAQLTMRAAEVGGHIAVPGLVLVWLRERFDRETRTGKAAP